MATRALRILIAEDSEIFAEVLRETIDAEPDMAVIAIAGDGEQAVHQCHQLSPDIVLMDIRMPKLDGLTATERIMADCPTPILVVTADPYHAGVDMSFRALGAGALDLMAKPTSMPWASTERESFLRKVRLLAQIPVVRHQRASRRRARIAYLGAPVAEGKPRPVVGIVASTGGPRALARLLAELPATFPAPIFVVQHIIPSFSTQLARWLDSVADLHVVEASCGVVAEPGTVYLAPAHVHMRLGQGLQVGLSEGEPVSGHLPSGDVLLESLARYASGHVFGMVMSGMGSDGTSGLAAIYRAGGTTLVQDRASSVVYGMPQTAIDLGVVQHVVDLDRLARKLVHEIDAVWAR